MIRRALPALVPILGAVASCNGTTGDTLLTFSAFASGAPGAAQSFQVPGSQTPPVPTFTIQLTTATMHIGALYFDESPPGTGFDGPVCLASGVYAAQVPGKVDVDLLSPNPQEFEVYGNGTADTALSWQVWLVDDQVGQDTVDSVSFTPIVNVQGIATDPNGRSVSFGGVVTANAVNRNKGSSDPTQPGNDPLCKVRIVQIGGIDLPFFPGGTLNVTVDPRVWFTQIQPIDFTPGQLPPITDVQNCNPDSSVVLNPAAYALPPETAPPASQTCGGSSQSCCNVSAGAVLFGGSGGSADLGDTWVFDGSWTQATVPDAPPARSEAGTTTLDGRVVLFGGSGATGSDLNDTWLFDGTSWASVYTSTPPPARERPSLAALGEQVVLFGGSRAGGTYLNDTWTFSVSAYSGTNAWASWKQASVSASPPARDGASMTSLGKQLVLFGGSTGAGAYLGDTWTFDGKTWTQVSAPASPSARAGASMATLNGKAVLFGGYVSGGQAGDTWTFDGTTWTQVTTATSPPARGDASMATFGGEVVLFGGRGASGVLGDAWTFDGTRWKQSTAATPPQARAGATMAALPGGQTCLGALTCTQGTCGPAYCIPNSSFLSVSGDVSTNASAAGLDFFTEIASGAPFSVTYTQPQP